MAGVKISALPAIVTPNVTDVFPVVQAGVTYKETVAQLGTLMLLLSGGTMTGNLTLAGDPTTALMAATKQYVDTVATGLNVQASCRVATTAALTVTYSNGASGVGATLTNAGAMAAINIDGVALSLNDRVLVKDQASTFQNGIYTVTTVGSGAANWVMTRATDFDTPSEIQPGDFVIITAGTVNASSSWVETATVTTIGTDAITFSQFSTGIPVTVPNGGTGRTTSTTAYGLIAAGTTATGAHQTLATGSSGQVLQSGGAAALPTYSTATYPSVATGTGTILRANGTNWVASTATYPDVATSTGSFLYANGTNYVASTSLWPNTVGSAGTILRSDGTTNAYTTSTFADTYAINTILYNASANTVTGLATVNSAFLTTSSGGVPTYNTNLPFNLVNTQVFTSDGTYTPTSGMKYCEVECIGGGGGGGGAANSAAGGSVGGGGGAGSYAKIILSAATVGASKAIDVGANGTGGAAGNNAGTAGADTTFGSTLCVGKGGSAGGGSAANSFGTGGAGGVAGTGTLTVVGGAGWQGVASSSTVVNSILSGTGGASYFGGGNGAQANSSAATTTGTNASGYGNGGNGGTSFANGGNAAGGNGSPGIVIVTEYIYS